MKMNQVALGIIAALTLTHCRSNEVFYANVQKAAVFVQMFSEHKYDFLWVMDNSGSMKPRRDFVRDNMQNFLNILNTRKAVDFQMAVTTTDFFTDAGKLIKSPNGLEVVKSEESNDSAGDMAAIIDNIQDSATSFWEQGLESSYQAVYQYGQKFMRKGVPLIIIYVSDENDYSCKGQCWGPEPEHNSNWEPFPWTRYTDFFSNVKAGENSDVFVFPIVATDDDRCSVASVGQRYMNVASNLGEPSVSGSVCDADMKTSYELIAKTLADRGIRFHLETKASPYGINVYVNHVLVPYSPDNYEFDEENNDIIFTGAAPNNGDIIEVTYAQDTK